MDIYTASEQAYKNGYEAGVKAFADRLRLMFYKVDILCPPRAIGITEKGIDYIEKELVGEADGTN